MNTFREQFLLNPDITYLNFGSFGACPKPVFEDYLKWERDLEYEPVQFIAFEANARLEYSRTALADYVNCEPDDLVYVPNPTHALNIITKSLQLHEGDEILSTGLEYGACDRAWDYYCSKSKAVYKRQPVNLPIQSKEEFLDGFFAGLSARTRVIFISHITSSTALIFPVKEICAMAKKNNILCIVDGAHAPGHIPLNIRDLDADIYIGACHKWMMAPKGCSFLYVRKSMQNNFDPLVIGWGYKSEKPSRSQFIDYHQMQGTRDFSAYLSVPAAISFMKKYNWEKVSEHCKKIVHENAKDFSQLLGSPLLAPLTNEFIGQMLSLEIKCGDPEKLQTTLFKKHRIEIPVMGHYGKIYLRFSINAFNSQQDLDRLKEALKEEMSLGLWSKFTH